MNIFLPGRRDGCLCDIGFADCGLRVLRIADCGRSRVVDLLLNCAADFGRSCLCLKGGLMGKWDGALTCGTERPCILSRRSIASSILANDSSAVIESCSESALFQGE